MNNEQMNNTINQNSPNINNLPDMNAYVNNSAPGVINQTVSNPDMQQSQNQVDNFQTTIQPDFSNIQNNINQEVQSSQPLNQNSTSVTQQIPNIPTVEQTNQNFVANTQAISVEKPVEGKKKVNYVLVVVLLLVVFLAIFFVFPVLKNYI